MRKALFAAACAAALGLAGPTFAETAGDISNTGDNSFVNGFNDTDTSTNATIGITDSGNDSSDNSANVDLTIDDTGNNNSDNSVNNDLQIDGSGNNSSDNSVNTTIEVNDVGNNNSTTRTSSNVNTLTATVTGASLTFTAGTNADQSGDFVSGNARVDTSGSFAGIQNTSANTGFATNVLVSNGLSANADISFAGAD